MTTHRIPADVFDALARGDGDTGGVLRAGQRSKRLLLLRELVAAVRSRAPGTVTDAHVAEAWAALADLQRRDRHAVDEVLLQPHVGAWVTLCLRDLSAGGAVRPKDIGHLGAVVASAALRAGQGVEVATYVDDGWLTLPTYGAAQLAGWHGWCRIRSRPRAGDVELVMADRRAAVPLGPDPEPGGTWLPLRRLRSSTDGLVIDVSIEDLDPYRSCGRLPVTARLDDRAVERWQAQMDEAWALLVDDHRPHAAAMEAGVACLVPLRPTDTAPQLSATCHEAVGAMAMTPPRTPLTLALALVHEFQHTKLWVLLDLVPLLDRPPVDRLFYAPWRPDPRPLRGLLHGAYAYLGLSRFWEAHRHHRSSSPPDRRVAHFEFAVQRVQVRRALTELRRSGRLHPLGARFVGGMARTVSALERRTVPSLPGSLARIACVDNAVSWRLRNVRPDVERVAEWAGDWLEGRSFTWSTGGCATVVDGGGPLPSDARLDLLRRRLASPDRWRDVGGARASAADVDLVAGRWGPALDAYRARIAQAPDDLASWAGLALARQHLPSAATRALAEAPEVVHALHRELDAVCRAAPDPEELARWVGDGIERTSPDRERSAPTEAVARSRE